MKENAELLYLMKIANEDYMNEEQEQYWMKEQKKLRFQSALAIRESENPPPLVTEEA